MDGPMSPAARKVAFFFPGNSFPSVSVTGARCELQCDYCHGRHLRAMVPISTPGDLLGLAKELQGRHARGFLLSGGCDKVGRVPLLPFVPAIQEIKRTTSLAVNLHAGLLDREEARAVVSSQADCYSVDVHGDETTIRETLHLPFDGDAYDSTLDALDLADAKRIVPHVIIGLSGPDGDNEKKAVRIVARHEVDALILLMHMPTQGTPLADTAAPSDALVLEVVSLAMASTDGPVLLGCMRGRGNHELEKECIRLGVAGMAMPSRRTVEWAAAEGYEVKVEKACCALHL